MFFNKFIWAYNFQDYSSIRHYMKYNNFNKKRTTFEQKVAVTLKYSILTTDSYKNPH